MRCQYARDNYMIKKRKVPKICFASSSGGHWEQLQKLEYFSDKYDVFFVTEKTQFEMPLSKYTASTEYASKKAFIP